MAKEICISSTPHETRLAILEDDQLAEIYYERENEYTLAGSIYKGRVTRVLPGMQSAFVDVGLERDAFLYVTDFLEEQEEDSADFERSDSGGNGSNRRGRETRDRASRANSVSRDAEPRVSAAEAPARPVSRKPQPIFPHPKLRAAATAATTAPTAVRTGVQDRGGDRGGEGGTRRWHGRRGRRFRGRGPRADQTSLESPEIVEEATSAEPVSLPERGAPGGMPAQNLPIVLPGESLSKYGGRSESRPGESKSAPSAPSGRGPAPARGSSFKPSTMVEVPTDWDGGSVLPGETLSRHRGSAVRQATVRPPKRSPRAPSPPL